MPSRPYEHMKVAKKILRLLIISYIGSLVMIHSECIDFSVAPVDMKINDERFSLFPPTTSLGKKLNILPRYRFPAR